MKPDNYMNFAVVCGFFVGFIFSILSFDDPGNIIAFTIIINVGLYIICKFAVAVFYTFMDFENKAINKKSLELHLQQYMDKFSRKEEEIKDVLDSIAKEQVAKEI